MLIVLQAAPCPTPLKAVAAEEAVGSIVAEKAIGSGERAVGIGLASGRTDADFAIRPPLDAGIIEGIDIHRLAQGVL